MNMTIYELFTEKELDYIKTNMPELYESIQGIPEEYEIPAELMEGTDE